MILSLLWFIIDWFYVNDTKYNIIQNNTVLMPESINEMFLSWA